MGPLTVEQFEVDMYFISTEDGRNFKTPVNQAHLRDYVPGMTQHIIFHHHLEQVGLNKLSEQQFEFVFYLIDA